MEKYDSLFKEPTNMDHYVAVDPLGRTDAMETGTQPADGRYMQVYADGYKFAADSLIDNRQGIPREDILLYPILFLYRHCLELKLKALLVGSSNLTENPVDIKSLDKHNISDLWGRLKGTLRSLKINFPNEEIKTFDRCIKELSDIDPIAIAFRYSQDLSCNQTFVGFIAIDIANVKEVMEHLFSSLEFVSISINQESEWRSEMESL
jgi:hypothetical protein